MSPIDGSVRAPMCDDSVSIPVLAAAATAGSISTMLTKRRAVDFCLVAASLCRCC